MKKFIAIILATLILSSCVSYGYGYRYAPYRPHYNHYHNHHYWR